MVAEDEATASNIVPRSARGLTSSDCSKASAVSVSHPSQDHLPPKKRNLICVIMYDNAENERVFPVKKRKSLLSFNQEGEENKKQDSAQGNQEEIQHHDPVGEEEVSNPIDLVAIAATWLAEDAAKNDEGSSAGTDNAGGSKDEIKKQQLFTKARSRTTRRRPRIDYTCLTDVTAFAHKIANIQESQIQEGGHEKEEDLYSKVKRRRGSKQQAEKEAGTRCSRVNGKGWRCSQTTRVGYALCEHHLGRQERLRRMGNLGSTVGPKKKRGRRKKKAAGAVAGDKNKTKSMRNIMETTETICKW